MSLIAGVAGTSIVFILVVAAAIAVSRAHHFRYRGRRAVTDEQYDRWRSWAVDTHEWSITDEADDDETEGLLGTGCDHRVATPDDLETR